MSLLQEEVRELERWIDEAALAHRRRVEAERLQDFFAAQLQQLEAEMARRAAERDAAQRSAGGPTGLIGPQALVFLFSNVIIKIVFWK